MSEELEPIYPKILVPAYQCPLCEKTYSLKYLVLKFEEDIDIDTIFTELLEDGCSTYSYKEDDDSDQDTVTFIDLFQLHHCENGGVGNATFVGFVPVTHEF